MGKLSEARPAYTFDDFVLVPNFSTIKSRKEPNVAYCSETYSQALPIFASPMNTVTEQEMVAAMMDMGANAVLHRYLSIEDQINKCQALLEQGYNDFFVALGASGDCFDRAQKLYDIGIRRFCVDVANGHSQVCVDAVKRLKRVYPGSIIMAGDVCSLDGTIRLAESGADLIRVGIGCGSVCVTRLVTGHGVPQLSALEECVEVKKNFPNVMLISDGGIKKSGDIVKALAIGSDFVMIGSLLAGTIEAPGNIIEENGKRYKYYAGMASEMGRSGWFETSKTSYVPEGVSTKISYMGKSAKNVIEELIGGLRVGMSYSNAHTIVELREKAQWRQVTSFGFIEGTPHGKRD